MVGAGADQPDDHHRREGSYVWDGDGNRLLDFSSQLVNTNIGHQHPQVVAAIQEQAAKLCTVAPQHANDARSEAARLIAERTPGDLNKIFFTNGGADANEHAVRMARLHTGRYKVLTRYRSYHGGTDTAINLTGDPRRWPNDYGNSGVVHFFGPFLYRSHFHATHRGGGERARAGTPGRRDPRSRGRRRSRRSCSSPSPAPPASWCRRRATWPVCANSATDTASCSSPTR